MLSPVLEKVTAEETLVTGSGKKVDLVTVDIDQQAELAQEYKVRTSGVFFPVFLVLPPCPFHATRLGGMVQFPALF
jgi:hypothetical protein